jgi:hypothetical protein
MGSCRDNQPKKMKAPNRIMMELLEKVMMFNCYACKRYWSFDDLNNHKNEERCIPDEKADNHSEKLAIRVPKSTADSKRRDAIKVKVESRNLFVLTMK